MKHFVKFNNIQDASGFELIDIPYLISINSGNDEYQNLHTCEKNKRIEVIDNIAQIADKYKGLKFKSHGQTTIALTNFMGNTPDIKYSLDYGDTWIQWDYSSISLNDDDIIYFKGNNPNGFSTSSSKYSKFVFGGNGTIEAYGNIMSLIDDGLCQTLAMPCSYCYFSMFNGCTSLTSAPELPATTLTNYCYQNIFFNCTSLTSAPELPATTLANWCYNQMFYGCTSLTSALKMPATTLDNYCYNAMFYDCTRLSYIKCLATSGINTNYSTTNWVSNVSSSGTFIKDSNVNWPTGNNGIPSGWTIQNA